MEREEMQVYASQWQSTVHMNHAYLIWNLIYIVFHFYLNRNICINSNLSEWGKIRAQEIPL
jgi:hypothetical protein